jgi:hypothetical protein
MQTARGHVMAPPAFAGKALAHKNEVIHAACFRDIKGLAGAGLPSRNKVDGCGMARYSAASVSQCGWTRPGQNRIMIPRLLSLQQIESL